MKLEVGQKIGIYESLVSVSNLYPFKTICRGDNLLGIGDKFIKLGYGVYAVVHLFHDNEIIKLREEEVRKVGSLIVKRLK